MSAIAKIPSAAPATASLATAAPAVAVHASTLRALIFDVDGTLADTEETHRQAFNYAFLEFGLDWEWSKSHYRELLRTSGGKERIARYIRTLGLPEPEIARLDQLVAGIHRSKTRLYSELIADGRCPLRPGIRRLIDEARAAGVLVAIASTTTAENVHALLTRHLGEAALHLFACIACGDHVEHKKPAPDIYRLALATLGVAPDACIAFEDSGNGLRAAKAAGLQTVVTPSQWTLGEDFGAADLVLSHLGDPDHPLPPAQAAAAEGPWLGLQELRRLHGAPDHTGGSPGTPDHAGVSQDAPWRGMSTAASAHPRLTDCIAAVAFDLDGTLVDTAPDLAAAANAMLVELGRTPLPVSRVAEMIGHGIERLVEDALGASAGDAVQFDLAFAVFHRCYAGRLFVESRIYPGVTEGLAALDAQGVPCCCITNKPGAFALPLLEAAGLAGALAFTLCADSPRLRKPAPDLLLDACLRLGLVPAQMLFVGDSSLDIEAARAAGCPVALVSYGYRRGADSGAARSDWIIGSLVEIAALPAPGDRANFEA